MRYKPLKVSTKWRDRRWEGEIKRNKKDKRKGEKKKKKKKKRHNKKTSKYQQQQVPTREISITRLSRQESLNIKVVMIMGMRECGREIKFTVSIRLNQCISGTPKLQ